MLRRFSRETRIYALLFCATLAAYIPALRAGFIWNDPDYVTKPALRSLRGLWRIWFDVGATQQYYPLLHSAFWFEHRLWGDAPFGYHLVNVLLHATSACLLIRVLHKLIDAKMVERTVPRTFSTPSDMRTESVRGTVRSTHSAHADAWIILAGFLFALHPIYVESVAWVSEQKNTLSTVFYLSSLFVYLKCRLISQEELQTCSPVREHRDPLKVPLLPERATIRPSSKKWYWISFLLFVCAVLTKTVAATLPGAILVILWWRQGRLSWKRDVVPMIPWFAVGGASGLFTAWVEKTYVGAQGADFALSFAQRAIVAGHGVWFYLGKLVWPADLIFIYPRWMVNAASARQWLYPLGVVVLAVLLWLYRKRSRAPLAALLFFLGSLFPVCGFFNLYAFIYSYVADHWQYLPSIGIMVFAAGLWGKISARSSAFQVACPEPVERARPEPVEGRIPAFTFPILVLIVLGVLTFRQSGMYSDMETFYRRTIEKNPDCWMAENNLGITLENEGKLSQAYDHYRRELEIQPSARAHYNLGMILRREGKPQEAIREFNQALRIDPNDADARNNLGSSLGSVGQLDAAIAQFRLALKIQPGSPGIRQNLGITLAQQGNIDAGISQLQEALRLSPDFADGYANLGSLLRSEHRYPEAISALQRAVQLEPGLADARVNLGTSLAIEKRYDEAAAQLSAAVRLRPDFAPAHFFLGAVYARTGQLEKARAEYAAALRIDPQFKNARAALDSLPPADAPAP